MTVKLTSWNTVVLENTDRLKPVKKLPTFYEAQNSLPYLHKATTGTYFETDKFHALPSKYPL